MDHCCCWVLLTAEPARPGVVAAVVVAATTRVTVITVQQQGRLEGHFQDLSLFRAAPQYWYSSLEISTTKSEEILIWATNFYFPNSLTVGLDLDNSKSLWLSTLILIHMQRIVTLHTTDCHWSMGSWDGEIFKYLSSGISGSMVI